MVVLAFLTFKIKEEFATDLMEWLEYKSLLLKMAHLPSVDNKRLAEILTTFYLLKENSWAIIYSSQIEL